MKLLLYGSKGWIGQQFLDLCIKNNIKYTIGIERLESHKLKDEVIKSKCTHIVSMTGRTHGIYEKEYIGTIDYLEKPGKLVDNIRDNIFGPIRLANISKELKLHYTYLGTGCIFDYDDNHLLNGKNGYNENDIPNFFGSSYSIVKGFTDRLMHDYPQILNLRIRMPIIGTHNSRNFITKITKYEKICSIPNSMSVLDELLPIMLDMVTKNITGTINLTNPGVISHNEILTMYKKYIDPSFEWKNFTIEEQDKILISKRSNNYLDTTKLQNMYPNVKHIMQSIDDLFKNWKTTNKLQRKMAKRWS